MDYRACVASNNCEDLYEGGVDGGPVVGEGGAGCSRALHLIINIALWACPLLQGGVTRIMV